MAAIRKTTVLLYQGDDLERLAELGEAIEAAKGDRTPLLNGETSLIDEALAEYNAFLAEAEARADRYPLRSIGRLAWRALVAAHPPREENADDAPLGVNEETFGPELIAACWVDDSVGDKVSAVNDLREADYDTLFAAAWVLNKTATAAPKAVKLSDVITKNDAT